MADENDCSLCGPLVGRVYLCGRPFGFEGFHLGCAAWKKHTEQIRQQAATIERLAVFLRECPAWIADPATPASPACRVAVGCDEPTDIIPVVADNGKMRLREWIERRDAALCQPSSWLRAFLAEDVPRLIAELRAARERPTKEEVGQMIESFASAREVLERNYRELFAAVWCLPSEEAAEAEIDHRQAVAEAKRMNRRIMELEREKKGEPA